MKIAEWKAVLKSIAHMRRRGQYHLGQRDGRGLCGRSIDVHRITNNINLVTCLDCQIRRMQNETSSEVIRNKGRFTKHTMQA